MNHFSEITSNYHTKQYYQNLCMCVDFLGLTVEKRASLSALLGELISRYSLSASGKILLDAIQYSTIEYNGISKHKTIKNSQLAIYEHNGSGRNAFLYSYTVHSKTLIAEASMIHHFNGWLTGLITLCRSSLDLKTIMILCIVLPALIAL